jgi:hypothetical protein
MVTLKDVAIAINAKLKQVLPQYKIQSTDIKEGFTRPCLYVDFDNATKSPFGSHGVERNIHVIVYFFPTSINQYKIEMLETQDILENAFDHSLTIKDGFVVFIDEATSDKVDGILQFSFDVHYIEIDYSESGEENMGIINLVI